MKFRILIDREKCKGCVLCVAFCPQSVLRMSRPLNSKGYRYAEPERPDSCTGCRTCTDICPDTAIELRQAAENPSRKTSVKTPAQVAVLSGEASS